MRALIADDEAPARAKLRRLLAAEPDVEVVGEAANGREAVDLLERVPSDLIFLDIQMPLLDGFGVIDEVGVEAMPRVVFVTAYDEYAVQAFEVQALDYLLKPFSPERLRAIVRRVQRDLVQRAPADIGERLEAFLNSTTPHRYLQRILVHREGRSVLIPVQKIDRLEAARNDVRLHTAGGTHVLHGTLGELAERLDPAMFLRVNRSTIIRLDAVKEFQPWFHGDYRILLHDGTELMWSRRYRARSRNIFELGRQPDRPLRSRR
jgi:two-component system LytT family response regulator